MSTILRRIVLIPEGTRYIGSEPPTNSKHTRVYEVKMIYLGTEEAVMKKWHRVIGLECQGERKKYTARSWLELARKMGIEVQKWGRPPYFNPIPYPTEWP